MKTILLTFDYELFFKNCGTPEKSLLEPTDRLIRLFEETGIRATFFIDVLYYQRLLQENKTTRETAEKIKAQLKDLIKRGHRIELHLHPHWLDAVYQDGGWTFPTYRNYRLHNLPQDKIKELFITGTETLNTIARKIEPDYQVLAFRAGGWSIQPFHLIREGFIQANLKVESSVVPGMFGKSEAHYLDFRNTVKKDSYHFSEDPLKENPAGEFLEIPITSYARNAFFKSGILLERVLNRRNLKSCGDGEGICFDKENFWSKLKTDHTYLSLEKIKPGTLTRLIDRSPYKLITILSHQKNLSESSYECLRRLHQNQSYKFMTMSEYYLGLIPPRKE